MLNARLHLICGNCGVEEDFTFAVIPEDKACEELETVNLYCGDCGTIHEKNKQD